jgi:hypothetical protein
VTFLVENRLRSAIWNEEVGSIDQIHPPPDIQERVDVVRNYPFISMDSKQYAAVSLDVKNINIGNANIPNDWKGATIHSITHDFHVGVSYVDTGTF